MPIPLSPVATGGPAKTPISAATVYATAADLIDRYDSRLLGQLSDDTNTPRSEAQLAADPKILAALADASGDVEAACLAGKRYSSNDLQALTGNSLAFLKRLVCDIAIGHLRKRRGIWEERDMVGYQDAQATLDMLRDGKEILAFEETAEAGLAMTSFYTQDELNDLNLVSRFAGRVFGNRSNSYRVP